MVNRYTFKNLTWVDLESPTPEEVRSMMDEFGLHPHVGEGILLPTKRPEAQFFDDHLYLVLHFPAFHHSHTTESQEVDFILGKNFLITTRYDTIDAILEFTKIFEAQAELGKHEKNAHAGSLFFYLMRHLYRATEDERAALGDEIEEIEQFMFNGKEREMVERISRAARYGVDAKSILRSHTSILRSLEGVGSDLFGASFKKYAEALCVEHSRILGEIESYRETVGELRETNNSLVSTKQNEIIKTLTVIAFLTSPPTLVAAMFSMNMQTTPIVGNPNDFWIVFCLMFGLFMLFYTYLHHKHWL